MKRKRKSRPAKLAKPLVFLALLAVAGGLIFWSWSRPPDPEAVFWQTVEGNLRSKSVSMQTEIRLDLPDRPKSLVLENQWEMAFGAVPAAQFNQRALFYDQLFAQQRNDNQLEQLSQAQASQLPEQVWYHQAVRVRPSAVWARQSLSAEPAVDDDGWRNFFSDGTEDPVIDGDWKSFEVEEAVRWQHFLMTAASYSGFFYGRLDNPSQRAEVMEQLRQAYRVDFEQSRSLRRQGRLLYEYRVAFDQAALGQAFISYFNFHLAASGSEALFLSPDLAANIFLFEELEHTVLIDAAARQITGIQQPLSINPGWVARGLSDSFVVAPFLAPVVGNAFLEDGLPLSIETRLIAQNQHLEIAPPAIGKEEEDQ